MKYVLVPPQNWIKHCFQPFFFILLLILWECSEADWRAGWHYMSCAVLSSRLDFFFLIVYWIRCSPFLWINTGAFQDLLMVPWTYVEFTYTLLIQTKNKKIVLKQQLKAGQNTQQTPSTAKLVIPVLKLNYGPIFR